MTKALRVAALAVLMIVYQFAPPYLVTPPATRDVPGLAAAAIETLFARLAALRDAPALDGRPLIDADPYNEWGYWDSIGCAPLPWDAIVTNQPIISAEYFDEEIHVALRGNAIRHGMDPTRVPATAR